MDTVWSSSFASADHPLWQEQVNLEYGMMRSGAKKVRDAVIKLERKGQLARSTVFRGIITDWLPGIADAIRSWVKDIEASRGPRPVAYPHIKELDPYVAALVTLRVILDGIAKERRKLVGVALEVGRTLEHEQRIRHWEAEAPDLFHHYKNEMDRNKATDVHRRRVNINRFNHLASGGNPEVQLHWTNWTNEEHFRVGVILLDVVCRKTQWFEFQQDPEHVWRKGANNSPQLVLVAKEGFRGWVGKAMDHAEVTSPDLKPTIVPPKRWTSTRDGGYWTPYVRTPRLVRFKASQESQQQGAADEYDAIDMPLVYDAVHLLQETPWRVNRRVLDVALTAWALDKGIAGLPEVADRELPARTPRMMAHQETMRQAAARGERVRPKPDEETDAEILAWKRKASPIHRFNVKRTSRMRATTSIIQLAQEYRDFEEFYFPHMLDFRGRIYPIPAFLHPQGNDLARGLLTFAEGAPLTAENGGGDWLAIHLASSWGNDKWSFTERIEWVHKNEALFRRIATDPLANLEWAVTEGPNKVDKPWQALAAIFEWVDYLDTGEGFMSSLPISVDGTCNGIQHLSAITRDKVAGTYVNLTPSERPQDIYKFVASQLQATLERIAAAGGLEGDKARYWLDLCDHNIPRTLTKRQVMVLPYGATRDSFFTYTRAWLDEMDPQQDMGEEGSKERNARVSFLALHLWDVVNEVVSGGMKVMEWLQRCAKAVAIANQPIYWKTPSGSVVRHFYGLETRQRVEIKLDGQRHLITRAERTAKLSTKEQVQGIAPNFIHALDASCLVECLRRCKEAGIHSFSSVHDAYGTHAANMWPLFTMLREAFVETHRHDVLGDFRNACQSVLVSALIVEEGLDPLSAAEKADEMLPEPLPLGDLNIEDVLASEYFFA